MKKINLYGRNGPLLLGFLVFSALAVTACGETGDVATLAKREFTVSFEANSGSPAPADQTVTYDGKAEEPPAMARNGYVFGGWFRETSFDNAWNFSADTVTKDTVLYAKWTPGAFTVTFNKNNSDLGSTEADPQTRAVTYPAHIETLPAAPQRAGYAFNGWNTEPGGTGSPITADSNITASVTVYAQWKINKFTSSNGIEMVWVAGGSFEMGKNLGTGGGIDMTPLHTVNLSGFYMAMKELTQGQYVIVMGMDDRFSAVNAGTDYGRGNNYPMYYVSWYDAVAFCNRLSLKEGLSPAYRISGTTNPNNWGDVPASGSSAWDAAEIVEGSDGYRLPTEAQWEYAAKGGNGTPGNYTYSGGNDLNDFAWYNSNGGGYNHEVGFKRANGLELYDMSGNVWEWCWDWSGNYTAEEATDPQGAPSGISRVTRGGSRYNPANAVRSVVRDSKYPFNRANDGGFRLVRP